MKNELIFLNGVFLNKHILDEGDMVTKHTHTFSHISIVAKGAVVVHMNGSEMLATAGDTVEIAANTPHRIEALTEATWICVHSDDPSPEAPHD